MTTALLSHRADNLSPFDLQVLKDFALEAPWEWRKAFDALIEIAEAAGGRSADEIAKLATSETIAKEELEMLREHVELFLKETRAQLYETKVPTGFGTALAHALDDLEKATEPKDVK